MDLLSDIAASGMYLRVSQVLVLLAYVAGFGALLFAASYLRRPERERAGGEAAPWPLVIGALRDTFLVSLLYLSEGFFYRMGDFSAAAMGEGGGSILVALAPLASDYGGFLALVAATIITVRRILILSRWLRD